MINEIFGENIAKTSVNTDTTTGEQQIEWNGLILVDLPRHGTTKFPLAEFYERFDLQQYDLFLCVFSGKFHETDTELFKKIRSHQKVSLLVRNQSDNMWQSGKTTEQLKEEVTLDAQKQVKSSEKVYFTSCKDHTGFGELNEAIFNNIDASKRERWDKTARAFTQEALERKKEACRKEITMKAGLSAANALNPIPGANIAVDLGILYTLFANIRDIYGLTEEKMQKEEILKNFGPLVSSILNFSTKEGIVILLKQFAGREIVVSLAKYIPFVGSAIAGSVAFGIIKVAGNSYADDCHKLAEEILKRELKS
jgi:hypothetical protein